MTSARSNVIENYIQRVTELSHSAQRLPSSEELEKIAAELGIGTEEIQAAERKANDHFIRAQSYMRLKHWDDAIDELIEAVGFNPCNLEMLSCLATAYSGRWLEKHHRDDEINVRARIKQCLAIKPDHEESLNLLAKFDRQVKWRKNARLMVVTAIVGSLLGGVSALFLFHSNLFPTASNKNENIEQVEINLSFQIEALRQQLQQTNQDIATIIATQQQDSYNNQDTINQLEARVIELEQQLQSLQQQIVYLQENRENL